MWLLVYETAAHGTAPLALLLLLDCSGCHVINNMRLVLAPAVIVLTSRKVTENSRLQTLKYSCVFIRFEYEIL